MRNITCVVFSSCVKAWFAFENIWLCFSPVHCMRCFDLYETSERKNISLKHVARPFVYWKWKFFYFCNRDRPGFVLKNELWNNCPSGIKLNLICQIQMLTNSTSLAPLQHKHRVIIISWVFSLLLTFAVAQKWCTKFVKCLCLWLVWDLRSVCMYGCLRRYSFAICWCVGRNEILKHGLPQAAQA